MKGFVSSDVESVDIFAILIDLQLYSIDASKKNIIIYTENCGNEERETRKKKKQEGERKKKE